MRHIASCRIDDRLIYRQVVTTWVKQTEDNHIIVTDEALVKDIFLQKIIKVAVFSNIRVDIYDIENGMCELKKEAEDKKRIAILVKIPQVVEVLIDEGIPPDKVTLGGMGARSGRRKLSHNVSVNEEEVECMQRIMNKHIPMYYQLAPNESPSDVGKMISGQERRSIMSVLQAVLLGIIHYLGNSSIIVGPVGYYPIYRPSASGCLTGMIPGDPVRGTMMGATMNLMYVGFTLVGGALLGDMCLAGIPGTTLEITGDLDTKATLVIAAPIGLIGISLRFGCLALDSIFTHMVNHLAEKGQAGKVRIPPTLLPQLVLLVFTFVPCTSAYYFGASYIQGTIDALGGTVLDILMIIEEMMPALGIGLMLMYTFKGEVKIFFLIGFLISVYLGLSMIATGLIPLCIAIVYIQKKESTGGNAT